MTASTRATLGGRGPRDRPGRRLLASVLIAAAFALFFAWDVWEAVGNLLGLRAYAASLGTDLNPTGWTVLVLGLVLPVLCFVVALVLGRRRGVAVRAGILAAALCLSAALSLDVQLILGVESLVSLS
ncbi:hypothetical protein [Rathayibacter tanaceti]|uniref:Uncharacterized protein n=2 Tax=Rathayibacter tanaceti TaxID=1671680 RepID=A0A166ID82_9MICO|nr:hypothetical protein [Rathayibacter tanaceti]KZX22191.1 hypothetical protein ACH61_00677 [Rathayibacter tanaceti]QHC55082.1 hypothetical protein GSU10_05165 [Rathayibacter tanaceti]TCO33824.1 hypothetical protein EV639_11339 [Rathayibacter tanaceti]